ncbi:Venom allergen 5, partial [Toxocara canis]
LEKNIVNAVNAWWSELKKYDAAKNPNNTFNDFVFSTSGHWSQLAWGATTLVGCGVSNCTTHNTLVVCEYRVA